MKEEKNPVHSLFGSFSDSIQNPDTKTFFTRLKQKKKKKDNKY